MARSANTHFALAVHVLTYLASVGAGRIVGSEELSISTGGNPVHLRRVLGPLREGGLVASRPGATGGWSLARPAAEIPLDEVWRCLRGDHPVLGLHHPDPACPVGALIERSITDLEASVAAALERELAGSTVADLAALADA